MRLVTDRGVAVLQAARDLDLAESVLRRWMRALSAAPAAAFPGNGQMRADLAEIAALKKEFVRLCEALEVSRSGFHAWLNRPTSTREIHDAKPVMAIETSFKTSDRTLWRDVLEEGLACGLHRTLRLMRCNAFKVQPRRRGKPKDYGERSIIADIEPVNATGSSEPARPGPGFPGRSAKPEVADQFHIHLDCRELAVCRASPWSL